MISIRLPHSLLLVLGLTQKSQVQMHFQNLLLSKLSQKNGKPRNTSHNVHLAQNNDVRFFFSELEKNLVLRYVHFRHYCAMYKVIQEMVEKKWIGRVYADKKCGTLHDFACHPCAGAMLIFSVSFQF